MPNSAFHEMLFSVSFGDNRRSDSVPQRRLCARNVKASDDLWSCSELVDTWNVQSRQKFSVSPLEKKTFVNEFQGEGSDFYHNR